MAVFETFFYIGAAVSISVFLFAVLPTLLISRKINKNKR